jgi:hypothetical protein
MAAAAKKPREIEADWDAKATQSAIDASRAVVGEHGINSRTMIQSLSDIEWGWIAAASIFAWIKTKSEQATAEGTGYDIPIRTMAHRDPAPWEAGAVSSILPSLGDLQGVDWSKPIGEWSKDAIVSFAWQIHRLTDAALAARDEGAVCSITRKLNQPEMERELSAAHGGPLLARGELDDDIPFNL